MVSERLFVLEHPWGGFAIHKRLIGIDEIQLKATVLLTDVPSYDVLMDTHGGFVAPAAR